MDHVAIGLYLLANRTEAGSIGAAHGPRSVPILGDGNWYAIALHFGSERGQVTNKVVPVHSIADRLRAKLGAMEHIRCDGTVLGALHDTVDGGLGLLP